MRLARNSAFLVLVSAVAIYWAAVWVLGTDLARDSVDMTSIFMGIIVALRLLPDAWDRFSKGGGKPGWQLLMGNVLWLLGWVCFCTWTYILRNEGRPEWMVQSPVNGFFKFWILGGIVLSHFATQGEVPPFMTPTRVYYTAVGVVVGILIGIAASRWVSG